MNRTAVFLWVLVLGLAAYLRFEGLDLRPLHADEATGARIVARALEGEYRFDPVHYHGPVFHRLGQWAASLAGQMKWEDMEISPLRAVTALAGWLTVALPCLGVRRFGHGRMLLVALGLAVSPLLVYYSRMFIHESLLALFGGLVGVQLVLGRHRWLIGVWLGLMFATKETFVFSGFAWALAGGACWLMMGKERPAPRVLLQRHGRDFAVGTLCFFAVSMAFYTDGFRHARGALDAFRTYFIYNTVDGHDKAATWYLDLLGMPEKRGGLWWWTGAPLLLALVALRSWRSSMAVRFLAISIGIQLLLYSCIAYKTPWLMVFPLVQIWLLAGFSLASLPRSNGARGALAAAGVMLFSWHGWQTYRSSFQYASEARNRFAYVPTSYDMLELEAWIDSLAEAHPALPITPIGIVGQGYWPLPWYLRHHPPVGHWEVPPPSLARLPLVFATTEVAAVLAETHVPIPRGLRDGDPVMAWVRQDFWEALIQP